MGIYNIRERVSKHYLAQNRNIDPENIDLLGTWIIEIEGDDDHFYDLLDYCENNDLSIQSNYDYVASQMEIDNYIDYLTTEMYLTNRDWWPSNMKYWRPRTVDGKWRWILYDTDDCFDIMGVPGDPTYNFDMFHVVTDDNIFLSTIFNVLIENDGFKERFINTFADYANTIFSAATVNAKIDTM